MSLCIVIPMKDPHCSKQRLSAIMAPKERQCVAINLLHQTLQFLVQNFSKYKVLIVTPSQDIVDIAKAYKVNFLLETTAHGLNAAVQSGANYCIQKGFSTQLLLPADIVNLDVSEFKQLLAIKPEHGSVVVCPSDDNGTNALMTTPPDAITFKYGANSSQKHYLSALAKNLQCQLLTLPNLALDLDTADDLKQLPSALINHLKNDSIHHRL